jgi:hypothetical protein
MIDVEMPSKPVRSRCSIQWVANHLPGCVIKVIDSNSTTDFDATTGVIGSSDSQTLAIARQRQAESKKVGRGFATNLLAQQDPPTSSSFFNPLIDKNIARTISCWTIKAWFGYRESSAIVRKTDGRSKLILIVATQQNLTSLDPFVVVFTQLITVDTTGTT